jgi:hypothetical protein
MCLKTASEIVLESDSGVLAFRASNALIAATEAAAAAKGISKSDVARRALIRALGLAPQPAEARS